MGIPEELLKDEVLGTATTFLVAVLLNKLNSPAAQQRGTTRAVDFSSLATVFRGDVTIRSFLNSHLHNLIPWRAGTLVLSSCLAGAHQVPCQRRVGQLVAPGSDTPPPAATPETRQRALRRRPSTTV